MSVENIASLCGILAAIGGLILSTINYIRYLDGQLESFRNKLKLQSSEINAALSLLDFRIRSLEKFTEKNSDFKSQYQRDEQTGSPFLDL